MPAPDKVHAHVVRHHTRRRPARPLHRPTPSPPAPSPRVPACLAPLTRASHPQIRAPPLLNAPGQARPICVRFGPHPTRPAVPPALDRAHSTPVAVPTRPGPSSPCLHAATPVAFVRTVTLARRPHGVPSPSSVPSPPFPARSTRPGPFFAYPRATAPFLRATFAQHHVCISQLVAPSVVHASSCPAWGRRGTAIICAPRPLPTHFVACPRPSPLACRPLPSCPRLACATALAHAVPHFCFSVL